MQRSTRLAASMVVVLAACAGNIKSPRGDTDGTVDSFEAGIKEPDAQGDGTGSDEPDAGGAATNDDGGEPGVTVPPTVGPVIDAPEVDSQGLPVAPAFGSPIRYTSKPGSVTLYLPAVAGVGDYRVFALTPNVKVTVTGGSSEHVEGAAIACAGLVQHGQCDQSEALTSFGPNFRVPNCSSDVRSVAVAKSVLRQVGLDGLSGKTTVVVEAVDALCPFPGAYGATHHDVRCEYDGAPTGTATYQGKTVTWPRGPSAFPIRTEQEIRADYGSLILNGQAPPPVVEGASPWASLALPAPNRDPKVLARAVIEVEAQPADQLPPGFVASDFYESFSDPNDQPKPVSGVRIVGSAIQAQNPTLLQTSKLNLYSFSADGPQFFLANGTLRSVLADIGQGIMGSNVIYPKRAYALPASDSTFIHTTFEIPTDASQRRYWWFHACGSATAGQTMPDGRIAAESGIVATPGFMNPIEGASVSSKGWNCLQIVPRGGSYEVMPGGPYKAKNLAGGRPETDLRVIINRPVANPTSLQQLIGSVVNVSPAQDKGTDAQLDGAWMRQWDETKKITGVMLDNQMFVEQRVKFDIFFNKGRIVVYANGVQKVCNDFPKQRLTMADAAIGIGHVFYHSSVERQDYMREDWIRTGQYQYLHNLPFVDQRNIDNFGIREGAALPTDFKAGQCYTAN